MMQAMIFAAGLGTRLKPLTDTMPKALVRVGGRPLIEHVILNLKQAGFERIVVNVHHFAQQIIDFLDENHQFGIDIRISDESEELLDTGGGIKKAMPLFDEQEPILIHNVDILSNVNLREFYLQNKTREATLLVSERKTKRYLLFDPIKHHLFGWQNIQTGEVRSPYEHLETSEYDRYAFSGIHLFSPQLRSCLNEMPDKFGIIDFYLKYCRDHTFIGRVEKNLQLMDVGKIDTLDDAEAFARQLTPLD
jgi:MurNAc alpha-1-phosphate uridylyltransferase